MTREEILAMKPGRELDALVAEKVMGWQHQREFWEDAVPTEIPRYSTNVSAAWEVVEQLQGSHLYTDIRTCSDFYEVWITNHADGKQTETFASPKLPEAICKAALLAVLEEIA